MPLLIEQDMETHDSDEDKKRFRRKILREKKLFEANYPTSLQQFISIAWNDFHCDHDMACDVYEDAVKDIFVKIKECTFPVIRCHLSTYIFGTAKHKLYKVLQKIKKDSEIDDYPNIDCTEPFYYMGDVETNLKKQYIEKMLSSLTRTQRTIMVYFMMGYSWEKTSAIMHKTVDYLKDQKHKIILKLQKKFKGLDWLLFL